MNVIWHISLIGSIVISFVFFSHTDYQKHDHNGIAIANLANGNSPELSLIKTKFERSNPGYRLSYEHEIRKIDPHNGSRILFIQDGGGTAQLYSGPSSKFSVGDAINLNAGEGLTTDSLFSCLVIEVPDKPSDDIPIFIRPDWDENITDVPGGCATETNAYRRILLTWKKEVGPYVFHGLNAHRVRIMDSFTHYHPVQGGFDEFYLVQMVMPDARLLTSNHLKYITRPEEVTIDRTVHLIKDTRLKVGDLVFIPRGIVHRGLGGALAQVITVPGFIPGAEIGVDYHLKKINDRLELKGPSALPYNKEAAISPVIK